MHYYYYYCHYYYYYYYYYYHYYYHDIRLRTLSGLKISYVAAAIMFQYYMCRVREITIVGVVQSSLRSNLKLLVIGQEHDTYSEPVLLKFT